jgi:putative endonuclease
LVYYEEFTSILAAIKREKQMKKWNRLWKEELIKGKNPTWRELYEDI